MKHIAMFLHEYVNRHADVPKIENRRNFYDTSYRDTTEHNKGLIALMRAGKQEEKVLMLRYAQLRLCWFTVI